MSDAYNDGASGSMFTGSTASEWADYQAGKATLGGSTGMGIPSFGGTLGFILIALAPLVLAVVSCVFPLAGFFALLTITGVNVLMEDGFGWMIIYISAFCPTYIVWMFSIALETSLQEYEWFRKARHVARICLMGFYVHVLAFGFFQRFDENASFFERLTVLHILIVAAGCYGAHLLSKKFDAGWTARVESVLPRVGIVERFRNKMRLRNKDTLATMATLEERVRSGQYSGR